MIQSRKGVPNYYEKSRDFQVFLTLLDLILNACYADTEYFSSLISPTHCKARLLPFLAHYVGYMYDYEESVKFNRVIIKNWSMLKRHRGCLTGLRMAMSLAMSQLEDLQSADIYKLFNVKVENSQDDYGRMVYKIKIYVYHTTYLSKLHDLIEAVRPAGVQIEIIPSIPIASSETVSLTDEFRMLGYDYATGKLIRIGAIPICVENSWQIMKGNDPTGEYLVDGAFYDIYHNKLELELDSKQRIINVITNEYTGELIKAPRIYKEYVKMQKRDADGNVIEEQVIEGSSQSQYENSGWIKADTDRLEYTGKYFNLEHAARVLNTCYEIRSGGKSTGYFVSADTWVITDDTKSRVQFYLKEEYLDDVLVRKVYGKDSDIKYNWHVDLQTGYFVKDDEGAEVNRDRDTVPWDEHSYISKKRYIMNTSDTGVMFTTEYFVNKHEDIQDTAGNIILSKQDRYKVSDSSYVGFSEVHNLDKTTTYDKTWNDARSRSYKDDKDYYTPYAAEDFNDYNTDSGYIDARIKIKPTDISITHIQREYDGTNYIGDISVSDGQSSIDPTNTRKIRIPISCADGSSLNMSESYMEINVNLKNGHNFFDVFSKVSLTFEDSNVSSNKNVFMTWKPADDAEQTYNFYEMPDRLAFPHMGTILPKTLKFDAKSPIILSPKIYDGSVEVKLEAVLTDVDSGGE